MLDRRITRRDFLRYSALAGTAGVLTACLPAGSQAPSGAPGSAAPGTSPAASALTGTLESWTPDTRDDALAAEKWWGDEFRKKYPGVELSQLTVPYGDDTSKLTAGHAAGVVPDMLYAYSQFMYTYGVDGLTRPANDLIDAIGRDRFIPAALDGITVDGNIYTVPQTGFPFFIYYRKDLYEAKGLKAPETHDQLLENIAAVHNPPDVYGFIVTNQALSDTWNLKSAMWTHGAYYFDENDALALDRPETLEAWRFFKKLATFSPPGSMAQSDLESRQLYVDGKVAHMLTTTSMSANFKPEDLPRFGGFLYPRKEGAKGASLDFQGNTIPTKAKSPEIAAAAIQFQLDPDNFQEYLARTVVGWVPMLQDAYTDTYLNNARIAPIREFIELGGESLKAGVIGTGYWGPSAKDSALTSTDVEKQIGDRLVVDNQEPEEVMTFALETINAAL
jgi:ABC-type glycerol-3-phosphate transport system substrate-binding protein